MVKIKEYTPVCPIGHDDCINDPAYIKENEPEWYEENYGALTPEEAVNVEGGCADLAANNDSENCYY